MFEAIRNALITEGRWEGYYQLTDLGAFITLVIGVALFLSVLGFLFKKSKISTRVLTYAGLSLAIAFALSYFRLWQMPMGGSVTPMSMFFVTFVGFLFGPAIGLVAGFTYGLLQFAQGPMVLHPFQLLLDYPLAFGMLGLSGFFYKIKGGLYIGFVVAVIGRFIMHVISGYFFFGQYAPEGTHPMWYSIIYNSSYIFTEATITVVLLLIPQVKNAAMHIKNLAGKEVTI
ncbi:MAG: energy-coupled thiamine transporter ThiT [Defluviitaleaceae bacterium]|nr:energy-coupled thiamine transporter ThiT [Defluviitaleaceae bacterium]